MSFSERIEPFPPHPSATTTPRQRVLVVDDSAFMRQLVREVITESGEFDVVGAARDGLDALRQVREFNPDLITLDIDMPGLDGLSTLERIMRECPRPVVMLSAGGSDGGADATLRALDLGAVDFVRKPSGAISLDLDAVREQLLQALRAAAAVDVARLGVVPVERRDRRQLEPAHSVPVGIPRFLVCVAASTGGPAALGQIIPALPRFPDAAVLIVQHMPPGFTASFAQRLHGVARMEVREAQEGDRLRPGHAYLAPGGWHLRVVGDPGGPMLRLDDGPTAWGVRPAADPLFTSAVALYGSACLGVVLTGMGRDGAAGLLEIRRAGGLGVVQDRASAVIPGMPDAALRAAGADEIAPLAAMAATITALVERLRYRGDR